MFLVYHFTVIIWCFLTESNRLLQQKLSLDGSPKALHGIPERSDGLQWSAEQPCNPSKPKAKPSPVKSNAPAAHLELKPDELAKKRGKVISSAQMIQHIFHTELVPSDRTFQKRLLSSERTRVKLHFPLVPKPCKSRWESSLGTLRIQMFKCNYTPSCLSLYGHSSDLGPFVQVLSILIAKAAPSRKVTQGR